MKRTACFLCAALMLLLCACGSSNQPASTDAPTPPPTETPAQVTPSPVPTAPATQEPDPVPTEDPVEEPDPEPAFVHPLTGLPTEEDLSGNKPVAIMLNNIKAAMPQQGNSQADIIYEVLAEGGITRMLGVYQDISKLGIVGSVRSARLYYLELALGHDAVFVHAGGSPEFYNKKEAWGLSTVDGVNGYYAYASTGLFWRNRERVPGNYYAYEHSLITSGEKLTQILTARNVLGAHRSGYENPLVFADWQKAAPADGDVITALAVPFSNYKSTTFHYDSETGLYSVEQYGTPYIDGNDGSQITVTNVIVLNTACSVVDDAGRITVDLSSGEGWFTCGGRFVSIRWEKGGKDQPLRYYDLSGNPLVLGKGKTYVCIIPRSYSPTVEVTEMN